MRKSIFLVLLLCLAAADFAVAGQFKIAHPPAMRKRQPPPGRRESRLDIINDDDRGYAIDVDYRRNRLEFAHRSRGDIFVPANSRISLVFDDDDDWRLYGDNESLDIKIRAGQTSTLRLETRTNRHQVGLFATVGDGPRRETRQLFKYADRPTMIRQPAPPAHAPAPKHQPPSAQKPRPQPHAAPAPKPAPQRTPPPPQQHGGPKGSSIGSVVGGVIDGLVDDKHGPRR